MVANVYKDAAQFQFREPVPVLQTNVQPGTGNEDDAGRAGMCSDGLTGPAEEERNSGERLI